MQEVQDSRVRTLRESFLEILLEKMKLSRLVQVSATIGLSNVVSIIGQVVETKILSITVGPVGTGLISQASQFQSSLSNIGVLPLGAAFCLLCCRPRYV